jgi:uroporphyrinogen III methyltransferase/synthase
MMAAGRSPATPAALVRWATRPEQQVIRGTLGTIAGKAERSGLVPPAILIAGEVARLGARLDWFARRPLAGLSIAVTRPRDQAAALSDHLCEEGARVIVAPSIALRPPRSRAPLDRAIRRLGRYRYLVFTSANGVERFFDRMGTLGIDVRALAGVEIVAIGPATAGAVRARGLRVAAVPEEYRAEGLLRVMGKRQVNGARVLIARAEKARAILPDVLRRRGALVEVVAVYRAVASREGWPELLRAIREDDLDLLTFTSSATVSRFMAKLRGTDRRKARRIPAAVIGPVTARTARENGLRVTAMPREYTVEALATTIVRRLRNSPSGTPRGS